MSWVALSTSEEFDDTAGWPGSAAARLAGPVGVQGVGDAGNGRAGRDGRRDVEGLDGLDGPDEGAGAGACDGDAVGATEGDGDGVEDDGSASFLPVPVSLCQMSTMPPMMSVT